MELIDFGNELLKREPKEFDFEEHDAKEFCDALFKKQQELGGIGLSANQVGLDAKVFVFGDGKDITRYIINPVIMGVGEETDLVKEGCLSLPEVFLMIRRPTRVTLKYQNTEGEDVVEEFVDLAARVVLHEYDHMIGQNFTQRASKLKLDRAIKSIKKKTVKNIRKKARSLV